DALAPAIDYARYGYPIAPNLAKMWKLAADRYGRLAGDPAFAEWFRTFTRDGEAPRAGQIVKLPNHADTLEKIAASNAEAFYCGELTERILADSREFGGFYCKEDFSEYDVRWVEPISVNYRGYDVCEIPPNGQGIVALMALNILKEFAFPQKESAETFHTQWEAMKLAFADGLHYVTDPGAMALDYYDMIRPAYGALRAKEIGETAKTPAAGTPPKGGTVYLCAADGEGNMISYIQSNYMGFGSGIVVRGTGISLQNRGHDFSLNEKDANCLMPRKRSYHTIIPGFLMKDGRAIGPFGVMGGYMQPQGHVQVAMNLIDFHLNPQQALDAPRWQWMRENRFLVEHGFSNEIAKQLAARGHKVEAALDGVPFGRGQMILRTPEGTLVGGTEKRTDSNIACY
ncbi:MAG TPA: gamma-glutamyltransferase family protein, partial [Clostridia bacterium]|nr:gamma-glutamyltransferase family protein [Clostridia bacterium]